MRGGQTVRAEIRRSDGGTVGRRCGNGRLRVRGRELRVGRPLRGCRWEVGLRVRVARLPGWGGRGLLPWGDGGHGLEQRRLGIGIRARIPRNRRRRRAIARSGRPEQRRLAIHIRPGTSRPRRRTGRRLPGSTRGGGTRNSRRLGVGLAARTWPRNTRAHRTRPLARRRHPHRTRPLVRRGHPHRTPPLIRRRHPHCPRRRSEPVVDGVARGRRPRVLRGVVVQLAPPVVLVTGRRSPLLAHAPNCPPHRPVGNGASGKSGARPSSNGVSDDVPNTRPPPGDARHTGPPDGPTPHGRTARRRLSDPAPTPLRAGARHGPGSRSK